MPGQEHNYYFAAIDAAKNGTRDLIAAPGAGKSLWIFGLVGYGLADGTVKLQDSTPTALTGTMPVFAAGQNMISFPMSPDPWKPWFKCTANTKLQVVLSVNTDFDGAVVYAIVEALPS